jgi:hypothetical protein
MALQGKKGCQGEGQMVGLAQAIDLRFNAKVANIITWPPQEELRAAMEKASEASAVAKAAEARRKELEGVAEAAERRVIELEEASERAARAAAQVWGWVGANMQHQKRGAQGGVVLLPASCHDSPTSAYSGAGDGD